MNNKFKWVKIAGICLLLVIIVAAAVVLYGKLSKDYGGDNLVQTEPDTAEQASEYAAPDFTVIDAEGNEVRLSDYRGKPVVLNFWATWCYYCKAEMPDFDKACEMYPEVQFLMVNATDGVKETVQGAKEYIEQQGFTFDVFFDTEYEAVNAYYVSGLPATFFIDKEGNLVTYGRGMLDFETLQRGIGMITE